MPPAGPGSSENMEARESTITIPDLTGIVQVGTYGDPLEPFAGNDGVEWVLAIRNTGGGNNLTSIGGARVDRVSDYPETPPAGYADGGMGEGYSWAGDAFESVTLIDDGRPDPTMIEPPDVVITDTGYTLPEVEGVEWSVNGEPAEPGTFEPDTSAGPVTVEILAMPAEGYEFDPPAVAVTATFEPAPEPDPEPDPEPEPEPDPGAAWPDPEPAPEAVIAAGGDRLAASLRWTSEADLAAARDAYETVLLVAWGYTRGRGFTEALEPTYPIGRVVAMAAARLAVNPEQLDRWQVSGDSETLNAFQGFTLAERHVLDRYRRRFA